MQQLVELHGGRVDVQSEGRDKGARFTVWLPLYVVTSAEDRTVPPDVQTPMPATAGADDKRSLDGLRILVVDDAADAVAAMHELLEMEGALVEEAGGGPEALAKARAQSFDVIVSDLAMPGMDGMSLLRQLRAMPGFENAAAIACSGFNRRQDVQQALAAGFDAHLSKPIGVRDLIEAILRVAKGRARKAARGNGPSRGTPGGNTPPDTAPTGNTSSGNTPTGNTPSGNTSSGATPSGSTLSGNTPSDNAP